MRVPEKARLRLQEGGALGQEGFHRVYRPQTAQANLATILALSFGFAGNYLR